MPLLVASRPLPSTVTGFQGRFLVPSRLIRIVSPTARHTVSPLSVAPSSDRVVHPAVGVEVGEDGDTLSPPPPFPFPASVPQPARSSVSVARARVVLRIGRMDGLLPSWTYHAPARIPV